MIGSMLNKNLKLILFIIAAAVVAAYLIFVTIPSIVLNRSYDGAKKIGEDIARSLQFTPEVIVNNTIVLNQQTPILEVATISQHFSHTYTWTNTWLHSTKQIEISGSFQAKAGFDLKKKFSIRIVDDVATIRLPAPELLSIQSNNDLVFKDENGVWNWVDEQDRARATNAFLEDARRFASQASFIDKTRESLEKELTEILKANGKSVVIEYDNPLPPRQ